MATNLTERIEKLEEILAAVGYEFGELALPQGIPDLNTAKQLSKFWERAKSAMCNAEEATADLVAIVANLEDMSAAIPTGGRGASEDGSRGANTEV
jgi:hypothetical protein